jgi:endoglucanase
MFGGARSRCGINSRPGPNHGVQSKGGTVKCVVSSCSPLWLTILLLSAMFTSLSRTTYAQGAGYWHTSGNQILDSNNHEVRIAGINWYGFETTDQVVHGLWSQDYHIILKAIKDNGYNVIRLPYSNQMVEAPLVPSSISFANGGGPINTDLQGLNSLEVMDKMISAAGTLGLRVILDNHRSEAGNSAEASGLWYTNAYPESAWIHDWQVLVGRYASYRDGSGDPVVIGADLRNEPHLSIYGSLTGSCWTGDSSLSGCPTSNTAKNWPAAAERAGNAVLTANPNLLVIVEGVDCYNGDCDWWGGNLEGVSSHPVTLRVSGRLVYSAHDYGPNLFQQSWFNSNTSLSSLSSVWHKFWEYVSVDNTAPIMVGEFGTDNNSSDIENSAAGSQGQWFESLATYLRDNPRLSWTYWALNGEDSYGLLDNQYDLTPASSLKQDELALMQFPLGGGGTNCTSLPSAPTELAASAVSPSAINLSWGAVNPPNGCSLTYNVYRSTSSGFAASSSIQIASGLASTSFADSALKSQTTYYYKVIAVDAKGLSPVSQQASAKTKSGNGSSCHVIYSIVNQWNDGFQAAISLNNTSSVSLTQWTLQWTFPGNQRIAGLWNGSYTQSGSSVTVNSLNYNGTIPAGGIYNGVGFTANFGGTNPTPSGFSLNGSACE